MIDFAPARRADALGLVAEAALATGLGTDTEDAPAVGRTERFQVVVHVSAETARRLACDSAVVEMRHDRDGGILDVGRWRRTVPAALRRALVERDRGCRFPGCGARFCDAHHAELWARGGTTRLDNLLLLCRHHHRRVHEEGWRVTLEGGGEARFRRPDGRLLPEVPETPGVPLDALAERAAGRGLGARRPRSAVGARNVSAETSGVRRRRHPGERRPVATSRE